MSLNVSMEFLGTMAGDQVHLTGIDKEKTYGRKYKSFGGSDDLRKKISKEGSATFGKGYKDIGEEYSFPPFDPTKRSSMPGGGYFVTIKTYADGDPQRNLNCFIYALGTFGSKLEKLAGKEMKEIQESVLATIDHVVEKYFNNVTEPEEGDLVIYSVSPGNCIFAPGGTQVSGTTHAGVYRKTKPNWNSPPGGSVESKWGFLMNPFVFQHDVFFTPDFYGDQVKFYRLKKLN